jgi:ankyrin repeat protein
MVKRNNFRFLVLLCSVILVLHVNSCGCDNFRKSSGPKRKNSQEEERTQDESNAMSRLEIKHDVTTNQITVIVHNQGSAIANMQLAYTNISPDEKGKTALLDDKPTDTLSADNIPVGGSKTFTLPLDFKDSLKSLFRFQVLQDRVEIAIAEKPFDKPIPELRLELIDKNNSVGLWDSELPLYYRIEQKSDKIPIDPNKLSLKIINQGLTDREAIFYNNQQLTELELSGTQLNKVGEAMDRLPINLGPSTTSVSVTLQLFYEGIPIGGPESLFWQANHNGPTQALFDAIFTSDLGKTTEFLTTNPTLIDATDEDGNTALHKALEKKNIDKNLIQLLLDGGAKLDTQSKGVYIQNQLVWGGDTPLHIALENENITPEIIELVLNKDPNMASVKDKEGGSLLHTAARNPKMTKEMIDLLISKGVDPSDKDGYGGLAVERAANGGNLETFKELFEKTPGIDVNTKDRQGHTLLQRAMWMNSVDVMEWLLDQPGIDVTSPVRWGYGNKRVPLLHEAVGSMRSTEAIEFLIQKLGNIDVPDEEGNTPLHVAVKWYIEHPWPHDLPRIEVLLQHRANKNLPNNAGVTPLQLVAASTHEELRKLFGM